MPPPLDLTYHQHCDQITRAGAELFPYSRRCVESPSFGGKQKVTYLNGTATASDTTATDMHRIED